MTTKLAGQFIKDFEAWRIEKIKKFMPSVTTVDPNSLTVADYLKLSTFNDAKIDIVKENTDKLMTNVINFYQSDLGLSAMAQATQEPAERPTLSPEILEFVGDAKGKELFPKYAKLSLLLSLYNSRKDSMYPTNIYAKQVEKDLKDLTANTYVALATMKLYFLALRDTLPAFLPFIYHAKTLIPKIKAYLLATEVTNKFVSDAFNFQTDHSTPDKLVDDSWRYNEIKAKLDIIDPTLSLSTSVTSQYYNTLLLVSTTQSMKKTPMLEKIFENAIIHFLEEADKKVSEISKTVNSLKSLFGGNIVALSTKVTQAFFHIQLEPTLSFGIKSNHVYGVSTAKFLQRLNKETPKGKSILNHPEFNNLMGDKNLHRVANGLLLGCQLLAIGYGAINYKKMNGFEKGLFWTSCGLTLLDLANAISDNKIFIKLGESIGKILSNNSGKVLAQISNSAKLFTKVSVSIARYVSPVLALVSAYFSLVDCLQYAKKQNWGMVAVSYVEYGAAIGLFISLISGSACAGPAALIFSGVLLAIGMFKMYYDFFTMIGEMIEEAKKGSPLSNFIYSVEEKYRISEDEFLILGFYALWNGTKSPTGKRALLTMRLLVYTKREQDLLKEYESKHPKILAEIKKYSK
ncbi:hypothetical protein PPL_02003 [Heterostelium album PN500]|uniref:Uncharacterized protein n=1 Tax=Heterostelium pallidum (strain ATCC 26659 / Pp 5 / PN500) TaxID=670386 RepID=D3B135_HETP5|nr:hypothetical protein PPL_02003 [Heterostelium album PN500]EFA85009.1 hypothetical protein PPL_02003 [Heterostelium album PN500]|eukprot:XP_020437119.1 hypothetical protein PPL_02003 [Heterostelium album PN500]